VNRRPRQYFHPGGDKGGGGSIPLASHPTRGGLYRLRGGDFGRMMKAGFCRKPCRGADPNPVLVGGPGNSETSWAIEGPVAEKYPDSLSRINGAWFFFIFSDGPERTAGTSCRPMGKEAGGAQWCLFFGGFAVSIFQTRRAQAGKGVEPGGPGQVLDFWFVWPAGGGAEMHGPALFLAGVGNFAGGARRCFPCGPFRGQDRRGAPPPGLSK